MAYTKLDPAFEKAFLKLKDAAVQERILKQLEKIRNNPELGKPMRYGRKGTREVRIPPFRLSYTYDANIIIFLEIYHKDEQ